MKTNVSLLTEILNSNVLYRYTQKLASREELAIYLASRGVLAVDSLTDEQIDDVWEVGCESVLTTDGDLEYDELRAALRRCATGEGET